ncbi:hypothetical protein DFH08DRAFT_833440 [Mycena albidolilacea]|uniref:Uncharacterized protein n=1 Tax=Mycena albidolilacea TaxID=1033008 RepID=A0AAD7ARD5_9AGAR|nr:hypothetical protein DFH08DRAFT_833440 [Mycena albidolilacea]
MPHRASRSSASAWYCGGIWILCAILILGGVISSAYIEEANATQRILVSKITNDTPVSGFYGPGAWWAWLITLGMTHGHMWAAWLTMGDLAAEWDYDLIAAGSYIIAASIDLILKSRQIAQLGEGASESPLLPALACAERVVSIGTGSSVFSVVTSLIGGSSGLHRAGIAMVPLLFALVASAFVLRAHEAISHTTPVLWCRLHNGIELGERELPYTAIDLPAWVFDATGSLAQLYVNRDYWIVVGVFVGVVAVVAPVLSLLQRRNLLRTLRSIGYGLRWVGLFVGLPLLLLVLLLVVFGGQWLSLWVFFWLPTYVLAFFPQMGYFPTTRISVWEMDQIAALVGIVFIAALRSFRRILQAAHPPAYSPTSSHELTSLLPTSNSPPCSAHPSCDLQRRSTY